MRAGGVVELGVLGVLGVLVVVLPDVEADSGGCVCETDVSGGCGCM